MPSEKTQAVPIRFHGKPVKAQLRTHSNTVHAAPKTSMRPGPSPRTARVKRAAQAGKRAINADRPKTANGTIHPKRSGFVSKANAIQ